MNEHVERLVDRFEQFSARERWMVLLAAMAVVYATFDVLWLGGIDRDKKQLESEWSVIRNDLNNAQQRATEAARTWAASPERRTQERMRDLEQQLKGLAERLSRQTADLIAPDQMVGVLQELLARSGDLELVGLRSLPAEPLIAASVDEARSEMVAKTAIYKHPFVVELQGGFHGTLRYLRSIEEQAWRLQWDAIEYEVLEHPNARITIELHTLGDSEGWIGV